METTIVYWVYIGVYWDSGKENGSYYVANDPSLATFTRRRCTQEAAAASVTHIPWVNPPPSNGYHKGLL